MTLADEIAEFVADEPGTEQIGPATWRFPFTFDGSEFSVIVSARGDQLLAYGTRLEPVPADRLQAVHELIADLNSELALAWFDCSRENRVVSARAALDTAGVDVTSVLVGNVVGAAVETMGRFLPAIDAVAAGEVEPSELRGEPGVPTLDISTATDDEITGFHDRHLG